MKRFFLLTIILTVVVTGKVGHKKLPPLQNVLTNSMCFLKVSGIRERT